MAAYKCCSSILLFSFFFQNSYALERHYYVAAVVVNWDYDIPRNQSTDSSYKKVVFREYTAGFKLPKSTPPWKGLLGPTLRGEVGDVIKVTFRNMADRYYSLHSHGIAYGKQSEGSLYFDNTSSFEKKDDAVPPGGEHEYIWEITEDIGPTKEDPSCLTYTYYSHMDTVKDFNSGLIGALLICKPGTLDFTGKQREFDEEFVLLFGIFNENKSWFNTHEGAGTEEKLFYTINGFQYGSLPELQICAYGNVALHLIGMSSEPEIFSIHFNGQVLRQNGRKVSTVSLITAASTTANMSINHPGTWLLSSQLPKHMEAGMYGYMNVQICEGKGPMSRRLTVKQKSLSQAWTYYIAAEETVWDYAPNMPEYVDRDYKAKYLEKGPNRIGKKYKKVVYVQYTDDTFTTKVEGRKLETGILGPVVRAQIRDIVKIVFKNKASRPYSIYPQGLSITKQYEGATYPKDDKGNQQHEVKPGQTFVYEWKVTEEDEPTDDDPRCLTRLYHSAVNSKRDIASGLIGPLLICKSESLSTRNVQIKADKEQQAVLAVFDENISWYIDDNIKSYCTEPSKVNKEDPQFYSSNVMHTINGYVYDSGTTLGFCHNEIVTWHVSSVGVQDDIQTAHFFGHTFEHNKGYEDVLALYPMTGETITMEMDNVGHWLLSSLMSQKNDKGKRLKFKDLECYSEDYNFYDFEPDSVIPSPKIEEDNIIDEGEDEDDNKNDEKDTGMVNELDEETEQWASLFGARSFKNKTKSSELENELVDLSAFLDDHDGDSLNSSETVLSGIQYNNTDHQKYMFKVTSVQNQTAEPPAQDLMATEVLDLNRQQTVFATSNEKDNSGDDFIQIDEYKEPLFTSSFEHIQTPDIISDCYISQSCDNSTSKIAQLSESLGSHLDNISLGLNSSTHEFKEQEENQYDVHHGTNNTSPSVEIIGYSMENKEGYNGSEERYTFPHDKGVHKVEKDIETLFNNTGNDMVFETWGMNNSFVFLENSTVEKKDLDGKPLRSKRSINLEIHLAQTDDHVEREDEFLNNGTENVFNISSTDKAQSNSSMDTQESDMDVSLGAKNEELENYNVLAESTRDLLNGSESDHSDSWIVGNQTQNLQTETRGTEFNTTVGVHINETETTSSDSENYGNNLSERSNSTTLFIPEEFKLVNRTLPETHSENLITESLSVAINNSLSRPSENITQNSLAVNLDYDLDSQEENPEKNKIAEEVVIYLKNKTNNGSRYGTITPLVDHSKDYWEYEGKSKPAQIEVPNELVKYTEEKPQEMDLNAVIPPSKAKPQRKPKSNLRIERKRKSQNGTLTSTSITNLGSAIAPRGHKPKGFGPRGLSPVAKEDQSWRSIVIGVPRGDFNDYDLFAPEDSNNKDMRSLDPEVPDSYEWVEYKDPYTTSGKSFSSLDDVTQYYSNKDKGNTRMYFIAAEEVPWDYAGYKGARRVEESNTDKRDMQFKKVVFRRYLDGTFTKPDIRGEINEHLGLLGPVIKAEIHDTIAIVFKNLATKPYSLHAHGVSYMKSMEGVGYEDDSPPNYKNDDAVLPGHNYTYIWNVNSKVGPKSKDTPCRAWVYYSGVNPKKDINSGLIGPLLICHEGFLKENIKDAREFFLLFMTFDENESWYFEENMKSIYKTNIIKNDPETRSKNIFHAINGIVYSLKGLRMYANELVRWYLINMGSQKDLHSIHFHGQTFLDKQGKDYRLGVYPLLPGTFSTIEMKPSRPGLWLLESEVGEYQKAGMQTLFLILDSDCSNPLGLISGSIANEQITASSHNGNWEPKLARLNNKGKYNAWSATGDTANSTWIQVDLQRPVVISKVATQGAKQMFTSLYVKEYWISYSTDKKRWIYYRGNSTTFRKNFEANKDAYGTVENIFDPPIIGRYIRLHPTDYYIRPTVRMELYGCELDGCSLPLGMENEDIDNRKITASSYASHWMLGKWVPSLARLNKEGSINAWQAKDSDSFQWLQIELNEKKKITGIIIQGAKSMGKEMYVQSYAVMYSDNSNTWTVYKEDPSSSERIFTGNTNASAHSKNYIYPPVFARFIRIIPKTWHKSIAMRVELLGCDFE
ncbi:coagulation factor V [Erpetoichthys calabaricus]|uniref:ferroxidase n=1 Tax=Erpetoichthys calabaricus TaxID=27687 RepID=A0A8C4S847_ERPCA|nr:coagulation factor V [Erpetoichthys calabaricus]